MYLLPVGEQHCAWTVRPLQGRDHIGMFTWGSAKPPPQAIVFVAFSDRSKVGREYSNRPKALDRYEFER